MAVVELGRDRGTGNEQLWFYCPGCGEHHRIPVTREKKSMPVCWNWNGSLDTPTCRPSVKTSWYTGDKVRAVCHFFIREGHIDFCKDCTHELAGQKVKMKEIA